MIGRFFDMKNLKWVIGWQEFCIFEASDAVATSLIARRLRRSVVCHVLVSLAALLPIALGCSHTPKYDSVVTGTVTVDGELAPGGIVTFHPADGGPVAIGNIHENGTYALRTGQGNLDDADGGTVRSGEYIVTVAVYLPTAADPTNSEESPEIREPDPEELYGVKARRAAGGPPAAGPQIAAAKYRSKDTSDLKRSVQKGLNVFVLELERAVPEEEVAEDDTGDEPPTAEPAAGTDDQPSVDPADDNTSGEPADTDTEDTGDSTEEGTDKTEAAQ